jgi:hypothetical protein
VKTERMTILVTPEQKAAITARAQRLGLSTGEMLRRAVETYDASKSENESVLNAIADEVFVAAKTARSALADANREVRATLKHLAGKRRTANGSP